MKRSNTLLHGSGIASVPNSETTMRLCCLLVRYELLCRNLLRYVTVPFLSWNWCSRAMPSNQWLYLQADINRRTRVGRYVMGCYTVPSCFIISCDKLMSRAHKQINTYSLVMSLNWVKQIKCICG